MLRLFAIAVHAVCLLLEKRDICRVREKSIGVFDKRRLLINSALLPNLEGPVRRVPARIVDPSFVYHRIQQDSSKMF